MQPLKLVATAILNALTSSVALARQTSPAPPSVSGKWAGKLIIAADDEDPIQAVLKQEGAVVTGVAGPSEQLQGAISKGKITTTKEGSTLTFDLELQGIRLQFELKVTKGLLKGIARIEQEGQKATATVELKPAK